MSFGIYLPRRVVVIQDKGCKSVTDIVWMNDTLLKWKMFRACSDPDTQEVPLKRCIFPIRFPSTCCLYPFPECTLTLHLTHMTWLSFLNGQSLTRLMPTEGARHLLAGCLWISSLPSICTIPLASLHRAVWAWKWHVLIISPSQGQELKGGEEKDPRGHLGNVEILMWLKDVGKLKHSRRQGHEIHNQSWS